VIGVTKIRTVCGGEVLNSWVNFAARLSSFGSTRRRKSTAKLQMCHEEWKSKWLVLIERDINPQMNTDSHQKPIE